MAWAQDTMWIGLQQPPAPVLEANALIAENVQI